MRREGRRHGERKYPDKSGRHLHLLTFGRDEARVPVNGSADIMAARKTGWEFATRLGFSPIEATLIAAITSELARIVIHGSRQGRITFHVLDDGGKRGLEVVARREDADETLPENATEQRELAGVEKLVDEFTIVSEEKSGTVVTLRKWR